MSEKSVPADERVWLITGCSRGFGQAIAEAALARNGHVVATARDAAALTPLSERFAGRVLPLALDVTEPAQIESVVTAAVERYGRIDTLVNNAGRAYIGAVEEITDAQLRAVFDLNFFAPINMVRAVLPYMRARHSGVIVQISSMLSYFISPGSSSYTASKAALEGISATLAAELVPHGVKVIIVEPGSHRTDLFAPSRVWMAKEIPAYEESVGPQRKMARSRDGQQIGDTVRASEIIVDVASDPNPPLRLPLGRDAFTLVTEALAAVDTNFREWEMVARSTEFGAPSVARPSVE